MNPRQREAVTADFGPVLVVAGPGSGKTRVLTHRIAYLIEEQGYPSHRILAVTFTNRAAREMRERVDGLVGEMGKRVTLGTFHNVCGMILRREHEHTAFSRDFVIYDSQDQIALVKKVLIDLGLDSNKHQPWPVLNAISGAKNELIGPEQFPVPNYDAEIARRVYLEYDKRLQASDARDFDDLLTHVVRLFQQHPDVLERYQRYYSYALVDEFQDTNMAQYELIRLLAGEAANIFVVGDPDQSIYAFRGADYRNVKRFQQDFNPATIILEENYRSHQYILDAATAIIRENPEHIRRNLFSQRKTGPKLTIHEAYNERDEAQYVLNAISDLVSSREYKRSEIAVLYRLNAQSRVLEETFVRSGMPYRLVGATAFYGRKEIRDTIAFMRLVNNPLDRVSLDRVINVPPRGIGDKTVEQFYAWADTMPGGVWGALQALVHGDQTPLSGRSRNTLTQFAEMLNRLRLKLDTSNPLELLDAVLEETGYMEYLQRDRTDQGQQRLDNIAEFRRVAYENTEKSLAGFLNEVALVSDVDNLDKGNADAPTFLTLHAAKGLEFPVVFIIGLEEGILPHRRALEDEKEMAEERRLMYVGLTRAKDRVYMIYTFRRMMWGYYDMNMPSRFIGNIPPEITLGGARVPQPPAEHLFYQPKWETKWEPTNTRQTETPKAAKPVPARKVAPSRFQKGQQVVHQAFGDGVVINTDSSGDFEIVDVLFKQHGSKKLDASFLQPKGEA